MAEKYTQGQLDTLLNARHRHKPRPHPVPWPDVAVAMGLPRSAGQPVTGPRGRRRPCKLERLYWGLLTGYTGPRARCARRVYNPGPTRTDNTGQPWTVQDLAALDQLQVGAEGQLREPPVDVAYLAGILARPVHEVEAKLASFKANPQGFFG